MQFDGLFPLILTESGNRLPAHIRV
jgi:hypothetical protein